MKYLLVLMSFFSVLTSFAKSNVTVCKLRDNKIKEIDIISSNIANMETTKTSSGSPYRRKELICDRNQKCIVKLSSEFNLRYLPDHTNAMESGFVAFPAIDLKNEMANLIRAQKSYERLDSACHASLKY